MIRIRVPATSANLGPGFDCLGLALDLWNEVVIEEDSQPGSFVEGEGAGSLDSPTDNLLTRSMETLFKACGASPCAVRITSTNQIPFSSGLGSSAAAILAGLAGGNELLGRPLDTQAMLALGTRLEGHPDNIAPALLGGLVVSAQDEGEIITVRYSLPELTAVVVLPSVNLPTQTARAVLPRSVPRADAVYNLGRVSMVVDALRSGDLSLLQKVMDDRLHQRFRLARIPGGETAFHTARRFGAAALSGAGPSIIIFLEPDRAKQAEPAIRYAFEQSGVRTRGFILKTTNLGLQVN